MVIVSIDVGVLCIKAWPNSAGDAKQVVGMAKLTGME